MAGTHHRRDFYNALPYEIVGYNLGAGGKLMKARANCGCGAHETVNLAHNLPPPLIIQKLEEKGWKQISKERMLCPRCRAPKKNDTDSELRRFQTNMEGGNVVNMTTTKTVTLAPAVEPGPRELTMGEMRKVMNYLEERFDAPKGLYEDGWSDERIANLAGVPRASVANIRNAGFGPLKMHPDIERLEKKVSDLLDQLTALAADISSTKKKLLEGR